MADVASPIQVQKFLKGVDYPAEKQRLIEAARREGADESVMETLNKLPDQRFNSPNDVAQQIGKLS